MSGPLDFLHRVRREHVAVALKPQTLRRLSTNFAPSASPRFNGQVCDGVHVDILTGTKWADSDATKLVPWILAEDFGARQQWSAQISAWHARQQTGNAASMIAAKLAKLWVRKVAFPLWNALLRPRGFMIEMIVKHVCESNRRAERSGWDGFVEFLRFCSTEPMEPIMWEWRNYCDHPRINWGSGPRVLDPLNPTNNLARQFRFWEDLHKLAKESLERIMHVSSSKSYRDWWGGSATPEPEVGPAADMQEVRRALAALDIPSRSIEALLDETWHGFTSLEFLCKYAKEQDLEDVGLNTVQRRRLMEAIQAGGIIFGKLRDEGRLPQTATEDSRYQEPPAAESCNEEPPKQKLALAFWERVSF